MTAWWRPPGSLPHPTASTATSHSETDYGAALRRTSDRHPWPRYAGSRPSGAPVERYGQPVLDSAIGVESFLPYLSEAVTVAAVMETRLFGSNLCSGMRTERMTANAHLVELGIRVFPGFLVAAGVHVNHVTMIPESEHRVKRNRKFILRLFVLISRWFSRESVDNRGR